MPELLINAIYAALLFGIVVCFGIYTYYQRKLGVPTVSSSRAVQEAALAEIEKILKNQQFSPLKKGRALIVDLGSGTGGFTARCARRFPHVDVVGIEYAPLPMFISVLLAWVMGFKNLRYVRQDFMQFDFSKTDIVYMYIDQLGDKVAPVLKKQLPAGACVLAAEIPFSEEMGFELYQQIAVPRSAGSLFMPETLYCYRSPGL